MLRQLYELGLKGHPQEFLSYRIIYLLHTRNRSGRSPPFHLPPNTFFPGLVTSTTLPSPSGPRTPPLLHQAHRARPRSSSALSSSRPRWQSDMAALLAQLTPTEKSDPGVHHALQIHASLATSNYVRFFRLFNTAPNMSGYILDHFVERERMSALTIMSKAWVFLFFFHSSLSCPRSLPLLESSHASSLEFSRYQREQADTTGIWPYPSPT